MRAISSVDALRYGGYVLNPMERIDPRGGTWSKKGSIDEREQFADIAH
jgi:hypothetical protein